MTSAGYDLEEIRRRAEIAEIVAPHVALRRAGRRLVGLCPFHKERTPSFTVDPETGLWHCFGCKAGGDLFRFVEMIEKVSFSEAVELLARRLGVAPRRPVDTARQRAKDRLISIHELASRFFRSRLTGEAGKTALSYLAERGLSRETVEAFGLGYAPDSWDALLTAMAKRGTKGEELARAGLVIPREGGFYDRFRNRIIFPIADATSRIVAFGGRALAEDQQPKYLNSPESPLFQKSRILYALDRARHAMAAAERAIVVEGYMDAIACHEAGLTETVATMGTALTADHAELLRRRVSNLVLAFDADSAGLSAALRGREIFAEAGIAVRVITMPAELDPDRVIRERGGEAFAAMVADAVPIVQWELERILGQVEGDDDRAKMEALQRTISALARMPAGVEREYYVRWLSQQWGAHDAAHAATTEVAIREQLARESKRGAPANRRMPQGPGRESREKGQALERPVAGRVQASVLAAFLQGEGLAARYCGELEEGDFALEAHHSILSAIRTLVAEQAPVSAQAVLERVPPEARGALAELSIAEVPPERLEESVASAVRRIFEERLRRRESLLQKRMAEVSNPSEGESLLRELTECRRRLSDMRARRLVGD